MLKQGDGQILSIVATYAWTGMPGVAHSAAAKAGVLALTRTLAREWGGRGVRANALAPGAFDSEGASPNLWPNEEIKERIKQTIPVGRFATAQEIATHALYLLSPACTYLNGEVLTADGVDDVARLENAEMRAAILHLERCTQPICRYFSFET